MSNEPEEKTEEQIALKAVEEPAPIRVSKLGETIVQLAIESRYDELKKSLDDSRLTDEDRRVIRLHMTEIKTILRDMGAQEVKGW